MTAKMCMEDGCVGCSCCVEERLWSTFCATCLRHYLHLQGCQQLRPSCLIPVLYLRLTLLATSTKAYCRFVTPLSNRRASNKHLYPIQVIRKSFVRGNQENIRIHAVWDTLPLILVLTDSINSSCILELRVCRHDAKRTRSNSYKNTIAYLCLSTPRCT